MNRMEPKPVRQPRMNPLNSATTPRENSNNASAMPRRGYLMTARGSAPGTRSPNEKALKGRANSCNNSNFLRLKRRPGVVVWPIAMLGRLVRPFRAGSGKAEEPKALPWAALRLPLWGVIGCTASWCHSSMNAGKDWQNLP